MNFEAAPEVLPKRATFSQPPCGAKVLAAILDHLSIPIMLVNEHAAVIYANKTAHACAAGPLTRAEHALAASDPRDMTRLWHAIGDACESRSVHAVIMEEAGPDPVVAVVAPFAGAPIHDDCALVLMRRSADIKQTLPNVLRELFELSAAETEIAVAMGRGTDINQVARDRGVKRNTLRSQLASIMERTGTHRQAELVALICRIDTII